MAGSELEEGVKSPALVVMKPTDGGGSSSCSWGGSWIWRLVGLFGKQRSRTAGARGWRLVGLLSPAEGCRTSGGGSPAGGPVHSLACCRLSVALRAGRSSCRRCRLEGQVQGGMSPAAGSGVGGAPGSGPCAALVLAKVGGSSRVWIGFVWRTRRDEKTEKKKTLRPIHLAVARSINIRDLSFCCVSVSLRLAFASPKAAFRSRLFVWASGGGTPNKQCPCKRGTEGN
jgi:hypothetical protein